MLISLKKKLIKIYEKYTRKINRFYITKRNMLEYAIKGNSIAVSKESFIIINKSEIITKKLIKHARKKGFKIATRDNLITYKNSNILFILGSGPSINEITEDQWTHISACDSIGFNWFLVHSHVPTYYHMEL